MMMNKANSPQDVWDEYQKCVSYKANLELFEKVERNEAFYIGDQWKGLENVTDLDKPVVNFLGRVVGYFVSTITSDRIGVNCKLFNTPKTDETEKIIKIIEAQIEQAIEVCELNSQAKDFVRYCAVDGDIGAHIYMDPNAPSGQRAKGLVAVEPISNLDVCFGNRQELNVEKQPWIIIASRMSVGELKEKLKGQEDAPTLTADSAPYESDIAQKDDSERVTVLTKYFKRNGVVWRYQCTENVEVTAEIEMGYKRYPVAWWTWEPVKDSYHGQAAITTLIPNQIAINKAYAMAWKQQRDLAFQKILYNKQHFPDGWSNRIGAIGVDGDPKEAVSVISGSADIPASTIPMIKTMLSDTRDMMGASDAALGNVNPDNTSAIIAVRQATAVPLELKKRSEQQFLEDIIRAMLEIITTDYGERGIVVADALGNEALEWFDFGTLKDKVLRLKIDVGGTNYWTPEMQAKQIENLWKAEIIRNRIQFIENLPDGILENKSKLLAEIKQEESVANAVQQMQGGNAGLAPGGTTTGVALPALQAGS